MKIKFANSPQCGEKESRGRCQILQKVALSLTAWSTTGGLSQVA